VSVLLDTRMWVWWLTPASPLTSRERSALDALATRREIGISAISLWEAQMLHRQRRLELPMAFADWLEQAADEQMLRVLPLDTQVVLAPDALPGRFPGDPADRVIAAAARAHRLPLATRDGAIRRSRAVTIWRA
jgi:PIN domain nuclease of toxin-antitoxin system